ncbi:BUD13 homolog [Prorops nasuta]|uniref:BUD13 homolog n=1 Tax=Prorops nasuta TaxID=863751 RepID=UPI0034CE6F8C
MNFNFKQIDYSIIHPPWWLSGERDGSATDIEEAAHSALDHFKKLTIEARHRRRQQNEEVFQRLENQRRTGQPLLELPRFKAHNRHQDIPISAQDEARRMQHALPRPSPRRDPQSSGESILSQTGPNRQSLRHRPRPEPINHRRRRYRRDFDENESDQDRYDSDLRPRHRRRRSYRSYSSSTDDSSEPDDYSTDRNTRQPLRHRIQDSSSERHPTRKGTKAVDTLQKWRISFDNERKECALKELRTPGNVAAPLTVPTAAYSKPTKANQACAAIEDLGSSDQSDSSSKKKKKEKVSTTKNEADAKPEKATVASFEVKPPNSPKKKSKRKGNSTPSSPIPPTTLPPGPPQQLGHWMSECPQPRPPRFSRTNSAPKRQETSNITSPSTLAGNVNTGRPSGSSQP